MQNKIKNLKIVLIFIFFYELSLQAFNFFPKQNKTIDFFWHLKIPILQYVPIQNSNIVKVAILDTFFDHAVTTWRCGPREHFYVKQKLDFGKNLSSIEQGEVGDQFSTSGKKDSISANIEGAFSDAFVKKKHGACVATLMKQIVPDLEIVSIPIFNEQGMTSKKKLCEGLQQALFENVDILYLGLKIEKNDNDDAQDQEIIRLLSSFSYVVVAAGNDAKFESKLAFPACAHNVFFSVGAFEKVSKKYVISDFSQFQKNIGPNFVMPGKDLACYTWSSDQAQNFIPCVASGTSMAAALFVGYLAHILMVAKQNFSVQQIRYILKKNSVMLDEKKWAGKVKFGTLSMVRIEDCLEKLQNLQIKMSPKKYIKNFAKNVDKIIKNYGRE